MIRPIAIALATGALCAALMALPAHAQEEEGPPQGFKVPMCQKGEAMPEGDLFALLERRAGEKVETMHSAGPEGHVIITANHRSGTWSEVLADGGTACMLRFGQDEETPA